MRVILENRGKLHELQDPLERLATMTLHRLVAALLLTLCSISLPAAERLGFKDVRLGAKYSDVVKLGRFDCAPLPEAKGNASTANTNEVIRSWESWLYNSSICKSKPNENETYGNEPVSVEIDVDARGNVERIRLTPLAGENGAERILAQLQKRWGQFTCEKRPTQSEGAAERRCWYENGMDAIVVFLKSTGPGLVEIRPRVMGGDVLPRRRKGDAAKDF